MWGTRLFDGVLPKSDARLLKPHQAQVAHNCWLTSGAVRPIPTPLSTGVDAGSTSGAIYRFSDTQWFVWPSDHDIDVVRAPVVFDTTSRTIWTGDDFPRMTSTVIMGAFSSPGIPVSRRLGIPSPTNPPTVTLVTQQDVDADIPKVSDAWTYTYVSDLGEEGPPSAPSAGLERSFDTSGNIQNVTVGTDAGVTGPYGLTKKRIYRTLTSNTGVTSYQLLVELPIVAGDYNDEALGSSLNDGLISNAYEQPPEGLTGLVALPNGILAGFEGRTVYFSEPYQPHAWPRDYVQVMESDVVGLGVFGLTLVVGTIGSPHVITGGHPATYIAAKMELDQACVSKRSFARVGMQGVAYASPDGLVLVGPGGGRIISRDAYSLQEWRALAPESIIATYHDNRYLAFHETGLAVFDPDTHSIVSFGDTIDSLYADRESDQLYVSTDNGEIEEWRTVEATGATVRNMRWRSRIETGSWRTFSAAQVVAKGYPVTFKLFGDGVERMSSDIMSKEAFRLPAAVEMYSEWEFEVSGGNEVQEVRIGTMMEMLG